jgi:hypothetical protein
VRPAVLPFLKNLVHRMYLKNSVSHLRKNADAGSLKSEQFNKRNSR